MFRKFAQKQENLTFLMWEGVTGKEPPALMAFNDVSINILLHLSICSSQCMAGPHLISVTYDPHYSRYHLFTSEKIPIFKKNFGKL